MSKGEHESTVHHIRPAARLIDTLGRDLIKDDLAAIIELVKNSYDADSEDVSVRFDYNTTKNLLIIRIKDHGHGMTYDTIVNKWLVPGTSDKLERKTSPKLIRQLQGRKGIGRYAAGILGQELFLSTTDEKGLTTQLLMDWAGMGEYEYLDQIEVIAETRKTKQSSGTEIEIHNQLDAKEKGIKLNDVWPDEKLNSLKTELSKLLSPLGKKATDNFAITLGFDSFPSHVYPSGTTIEIEPLPLLDLYDYRIHGSISKNGNIHATYENQNIKNAKPEVIKSNIKRVEKADSIDDEAATATCGALTFDIRVFDRDPEAIDELIKRAKSAVDWQLGKRDTRKLLDEFNGVGVYRGGFRIRPYGDKGFDWLNLDFRRIQIPTVRISSNQVIGIVDIEPEEVSGLEEKSARDGLRENASYLALRVHLARIIKLLEDRRYAYRISAGRGRKLVTVEKALESLFDFDRLTEDVKTGLKKLKVPDNAISNIVKSIDDVKEEKAKALEDIKETIALYQGQASLGRMVGYVMHEGRKPLSYLNQRFPKLQQWAEVVLKNPGDKKTLEKMKGEVPDLSAAVERLTNMFKTLDPFAIKKGERPKTLQLAAAIRQALKLFGEEIEQAQIKVEVKIQPDAEVYARPTDLSYIFSNLAENSIYWLKHSKPKDRRITVTLAQDSDAFKVVSFQDNGPGIPDELLENGRLFEPGVSLKENGTGLGLALVGEMTKRNNGEVWASMKDEGISFFIQIPAQRGNAK